MARRDKGQYQLTERDIKIFDFVGPQRIVRLDQFQLLMTRYSEYEFEPGELIGYPTIMERVRKLRDAGYIHYKRILADGPGWVWLTKQGLRAANFDFSAQPPAWRDLPHLYAINQVRLFTDWAYWRCERYIRQSKQQGSIPDALIWQTKDDFDANRSIAIEVEISLKRVGLRERKLRELVNIFGGYDRVRMYVPNEKIFKAMDSARRKLEDRQQDRVELVMLPLIDPGMPDY